MRVGFLSSQNYRSRTTFSGTLFSMFSSLSDEVPVVELGWPMQPGPLEEIRRKLGLAPPLDATASTFAEFSSAFHEVVRRQLRRARCDLLFAPVASYELYDLVCDVPIVYASDATFRLYRLHYEPKMSPECEALLERMERQAIGRSRRLLYPSRWAAQSARCDYLARPDAIEVVPYGANLSQAPARAEVLQKLEGARGDDCQLLFVGRDFHRKGGDRALETLGCLRARGVAAHLTVVGTRVPGHDGADPAVTVIPYLDKNDPGDAQRLRELYLKSHFLVFPTRADCSPIALCEAAAFGLPVVSSNVGGIADIVEPGVSGALVPRHAGGDAYADEIEDVWRDERRYRALVTGARALYDRRLNWRVWARTTAQAFERALAAA